jgi:hypothetical protein
MKTKYKSNIIPESIVKNMGPKNGTVRHSKDIDWDHDPFKRTHETNPGFYVWFGLWKGPFDSINDATQAYREWAWEAKHS